MQTYCFDIDGTLCTQETSNYASAKPFQDRIDRVNALFREGHRIILFTARGSKSGLDWRESTVQQLESWGVSFHELILGKPHADFYIDDKAIHPDYFDW